MKYSFLPIIALLFLFSCSRPSPTKIQFDGKTFELPMKVDQAQKALDLKYMYYMGFMAHAKAEDPFIKTQLTGYPAFMGSDNDSEESYYDDYFVGISFMQPQKIYQNQKAALEKKFGKKFILQKNYSYFETNDGLIVTIKTIPLRSMPSKKYLAISFHKGIKLDELDAYMDFVEM